MMTTRSISRESSLSRTPRENTGNLSEATRRKALDIARWLTEKNARDLSVVDVSPFSSVADVMIILTAQGARHAQALADWLLEKFSENKLTYLGMEGYSEGRWILVDTNDVLVHIFQEESRSFYNLDGLWSQSRSLLTNLEPAPSPSEPTKPTPPARQRPADPS